MIPPTDDVRFFLDRYAVGTLPEPLHTGGRFLRACPQVYSVVRPVEGRLWLALIFSRAPGQGEGGKALCRLADECGVPLHLIVGRPARLSAPYLDDAALTAWYGRNGFVACGRDAGRPVMTRRPCACIPHAAS